MRSNGCITGGREDPLVGGEQIVCVGMEVRDPADHRRAGDQVLTAGQRVGHQTRVACVPADEPVARMAVEGADDVPVL